MPPIKHLPSKARDALIQRLNELQDMLKSEKFDQLIHQLDASLEAQQTALGGVNALLKDNGISVPQGVTFHVRANPASKQRSQVQVTMEIYFEHPGANASSRT